MKSDLKDLFKVMVADGWRINHGTKHLMCYAPNGKDILTVAGTSSDRNLIRVLGRQMKHIGYVGYTRYYR